MREIPLTQGQVAIVDDEDYDTLSPFKWRANWNPKGATFYAIRGVKVPGTRKNTAIWMARLIAGAQDGQICDHINHDTLDNRRANLRLVTTRQSALNKRLLSKLNTSGYRGVSFYRPGKCWRASIRVKGQTIYLGSFASPEDAARVYDDAVRKYHEGVAPLNFPEDLDRLVAASRHVPRGERPNRIEVVDAPLKTLPKRRGRKSTTAN